MLRLEEGSGPANKKAPPRGGAEVSACSPAQRFQGKRPAHHRGLVDHEQVAGERLVPAAPEAARGRVDLEQPVASSGPRARCFRSGAARRGRSAPRAAIPTPLAASTVRTASSRVVLPTPGPPVITSTFAASACRSAARWLSASARPAAPPPRATPCRRRSPARAAGGGRAPPAARRWPPRRDAGPGGRRSGALDRVGHDLARRERVVERGRDEIRRRVQELARPAPRGVLGRQPAMALVHRLGQRIRIPARRRIGAVCVDAERWRRSGRRSEADAADVAGEPLGVLRDDLHGVGP